MYEVIKYFIDMFLEEIVEILSILKYTLFLHGIDILW